MTTEAALAYRISTLERAAKIHAEQLSRLHQLLCLVQQHPSAPNHVAHDAIEFVSRKSGIRTAVVTGRLRNEETALWRFIAMWLMRLSGMSFSAIGRALHRDHTDVVHGCRRLKARMETEPSIANLVAEITEEWNKTRTPNEPTRT